MRKTSWYLCSCSAFPGFLGEPLKNEHKPLQAPIPTVTRWQARTCVCQGLVFLGEPRALGCRAEASEPLPGERSCCPGEKGRVTDPHGPLSLLQPSRDPQTHRGSGGTRCSRSSDHTGTSAASERQLCTRAVTSTCASLSYYWKRTVPRAREPAAELGNPRLSPVPAHSATQPAPDPSAGN